MPSGGPSNDKQAGHERESSDEDYDDQYLDTYPRGASIHEKQDEPGDDELPDTTMLDSVILPAIASVRVPFSQSDKANQRMQLFPRVSTQEARVALSALQRAFNEAERIIPGVTLELVNEIVDSVERVEDDQQQ
jgi:serine/threonine-protein kinase 24/25/MST4